nr:decaprenyl-phosphate phosphoribosyltransferase [uncultured Cohaesibacter sp.]
MENNPSSSHHGISILAMIKLLRPKQWIKNSFVLAPLAFSGLFLDGAAIKAALIAMLYFCAASSATYILNDYQDIERDRQHPKKSKSRPLASGEVSTSQAAVLLLMLYGFICTSYFFSPSVTWILLIYMLQNIAYTYILKHQPVIDIFLIAIGFVLRVYAGAFVLDVPVSSWMFSTTLCLALYLASIKRLQELQQSGQDGRSVLKYYTPKLVERYAEMSATGALLFYSLFVITNQPQMAITIPIVLFGLFRYWFIVDTQDGGESPTDALLSDWQILLTILVWISTCLWILAQSHV